MRLVTLMSSEDLFEELAIMLDKIEPEKRLCMYFGHNDEPPRWRRIIEELKTRCSPNPPCSKGCRPWTPDECAAFRKERAK